MSKTLNYPESVPIVKAADMLKRDYDDGCGRMCLEGRFFSTFRCTNSFTPLYPQFKDFVFSHRHSQGKGNIVSAINDNIVKTRSAEIWNEFVASLGYTEISLEAVG